MELHFVSPFVSLWCVGRASLPRQFDGVYKALWTGGVAGRSLCGCRKQQGTVFLWRWIEDVHGCMHCMSSSVWEQMFLYTEISTQKWKAGEAQRPWPKVSGSQEGLPFLLGPELCFFLGEVMLSQAHRGGPEKVGWGGEKKLLCKCLEWCCWRSSVGTDPHYCRKHKLISFELERVALHSGQVL